MLLITLYRAATRSRSAVCAPHVGLQLQSRTHTVESSMPRPHARRGTRSRISKDAHTRWGTERVDTHIDEALRKRQNRSRLSPAVDCPGTRTSPVASSTADGLRLADTDSSIVAGSADPARSSRDPNCRSEKPNCANAVTIIATLQEERGTSHAPHRWSWPNICTTAAHHTWSIPSKGTPRGYGLSLLIGM